MDSIDEHPALASFWHESDTDSEHTSAIMMSNNEMSGFVFRCWKDDGVNVMRLNENLLLSSIA